MHAVRPCPAVYIYLSNHGIGYVRAWPGGADAAPSAQLAEGPFR